MSGSTTCRSFDNVLCTVVCWRFPGLLATGLMCGIQGDTYADSAAVAGLDKLADARASHPCACFPVAVAVIDNEP